MVDYAWSHAVISDETYKTIKASCDFNSSDPWSNKDCSQGVDEVLKQYNEIDIYSLYTSTCFASTARSNDRSMQMVMLRSSKMVSYDQTKHHRTTLYTNIYTVELRDFTFNKSCLMLLVWPFHYQNAFKRISVIKIKKENIRILYYKNE